MYQQGHTWIAIRAIALLEDEGEVPDLVKLLKPYVKEAAIGSWLPDDRDRKLRVDPMADNHIFKLQPYLKRHNRKRFILPKSKLLKKLGSSRALYNYLKQDKFLKDPWWKRPYQAVVKPGKHIPNRAQSLTTAIVDLLLLGDTRVEDLVPGKLSYSKYLHENARSRSQLIALHCFMLSHFVADASMPCHCDKRDLSDSGKGLHGELEEHWSSLVGSYFKKKKLDEVKDSASEILDKARERDDKFYINFTNEVPDLVSEDVWYELVNVCRGSFALACIIAPPNIYKYKPNDKKLAPFETVFSGSDGEELLEWVDWVCLHDAVLNTAVVWKHIWKKFG